MDSSSEHPITDAKSAARESAELQMTLARTSLRERIARYIIVMLGAVLLAAAGAASSTENAASAPFRAQIVARLNALVPKGVQIDDVTLGCNPPADATVVDVAPGLTKLQSRGFLVEFAVGKRTMGCSASMNARRTVLAAIREIAPGEPVSRTDLKGLEIEAFAAAPGALEEFPQSGLYVAASQLRADQPVYPTQITRPTAIHAGDVVTVIVRNGPITLRAQLEARSNAAVGDRAVLANTQTGATIDAQVTGERTAELVMR